VVRPVETFTPAELELLAPHFTNANEPVFGLVNLPETVKGALFARYSRYPGTLRRLFLDEFADSLEGGAVAFEGSEGKRAADLYDRIFLGYGDDSVAQLGGMHIACEWVSNVLTKILQRPRLAAYLEQSTRYLAWDEPMPGGGFRYHREEALGADYEAAMDRIFTIYSEALPAVTAWAAEAYPRGDEPEAAHARAVRAKALDLLRGLLPAASLAHMGMYATGQTYEQLILHLLAHPLPEAREYGRMILSTVQQVMPSFVARVERPERGGEWITFLEQREAAGRKWSDRLGIEAEAQADPGPSVQLLSVEGDETSLLSALLFESSGLSERDVRSRIEALSAQERSQLLTDLAGDRRNRRHRPGRGLESLRYRFEIVADYGAFRDLQRHRMLTVQWQTLSPQLGAGVPGEVEQAGRGDAYSEALELSAATWQSLVDAGLPAQAPYALCLGYRIRFILDLNAREAMQLIELRSGREGHPTYRAVALAMRDRIAVAHPSVAALMTHVDEESEPRLERMMSELKAEAKAG
jgi:thymidylate synthase ThyX